jgi:hypothetical protein
LGHALRTATVPLPATWPAGPTDQQMQAHLDIAVDDLDAAGELAREAGATP